MHNQNEWKTYISNINKSIKGLQALKKIAHWHLLEASLNDTSDVKHLPLSKR